MAQNDFAKKTNTSMLAMMALLVTLILLLAYTPIGTIYIGPISMNLAGLPVIIGAMILGLRPGITLGAIWGAVQLSKTFIFPSPMLSPLLFSPAHWYDPILFVLLMLVPRMLVPVTAYVVSRIGKSVAGKVLTYGIASALASLTNTVFFLGMLYLMFMDSLAANYGTNTQAIAAMLFGVATTNGLIEAAVSIVCSPIAIALEKSVKGLPVAQRDAAKAAKRKAKEEAKAAKAAGAAVADTAVDAADTAANAVEGAADAVADVAADAEAAAPKTPEDTMEETFE